MSLKTRCDGEDAGLGPQGRAGLRSSLLRGVLATCAVAGCAIPPRTGTNPAGDGLVLVRDGLSPYRIVLPLLSSPKEELAARELQFYLREMSGTVLPIVTINAPPSEHEILLGNSLDRRETGVEIDFDAFGLEGFKILTAGPRLIIAGGRGNGTLYGVYAFLEEHLGCRWFSPTAEVIPRRPTITLDGIDNAQQPGTESRMIRYNHLYDNTFARKLKLNANSDPEYDRVSHHTFARLVPPGEYFDEHPEYFSMVNGRRVPNGQLCLTNPDVLQIAVESLRVQIERRPEQKLLVVGQNDNVTYCRCPECAAVSEREGAESGLMLEFVNKIAKRFPEHIVTTFAYQHTRAAPRSVCPTNNVWVTLCSIECNRSLPLESDPSSASFREDVEAWGRITRNIVVWDYIIQFANLLSPFPNLRVLQPNIQYFRRNNINMIFEQAHGGMPLGEFAELRSYLVAKLLWNPDADANAVIDDFLEGYYGSAAPWLRRYVNRLHDAMESSGRGMSIFGGPEDACQGYLAPNLVEEYDRLFDKAEDAVRHHPDYAHRVEKARLSLRYAKIRLAWAHYSGPHGIFLDDSDRSRVRPGLREELVEFIALCKKHDITQLKEHGLPPEQFRLFFEEIFDKGEVLRHLAFGRPVRLATPYSRNYPAGGDNALTDGVRGIAIEYGSHWQGFEENDLDAVVDLGEAKEIRGIAISYLTSIGSWIFPPRTVEFQISSDGEDFRTIETAAIPTPGPEDAGSIETKTVESDVQGQTARYVRVIARNTGVCPPWHIGAGGKAWLFVDEIIVR